MDYGYLALFVGTFLEGETILIIGGFFAYEGYLELPLVILSAFCGSLFGDQLYFFLGRYNGHALLRRFPRFEPQVERFRRLMVRHDTWIILIFRFLYGFRNIAPFAMGVSHVSTKKFVILNIISAVVWATTLGILGYFFGTAMEAVLDDIKKYELYVLGGVFLLAVIIFFTKYQYRKIKTKKKIDKFIKM